ncbi:MAG: SpoIIE family protein phosphatase [Planctomycetes bacterium]|nr:SpoIIE family protein phosphatase [Planctomycetota bacterium]
MPFLVVMGSPAVGSKFPLTPNRDMLIGRSGFCDIVLNKRSISREHARVFERGGDYYIQDLDSINGTFVNGSPVRGEVRLKDGDRINLFDVPVNFNLFDDTNNPSSGSMFVFDGASPPSPPPVESRLRARLENILDIIHQLGNNLKIDVILPKVLDILFQMFPQASNGEIQLMDQEGNLSPRATLHGRSGETSTLTQFPADIQLSRRVLESGEALIEESGDATGDSALESSFSSSIFAPIIGHGGTPFGVIVLETEEPGSRFGPDDSSLVCGVAMIAAQSIGYARAHETVIEHELTRHYLQTAREIQLRMLPRECPRVPGYTFAKYYRAAQIVGGDAYSYHTLIDGRVMIAVADAAGKGLPASLKIAEFLSEIRHCVASATSLKAAMDYLNRFVCRSDDGFITFCMAVLDPQQNSVSIANAGHPPPRLRRRDGTILMVGRDRISFPLGLMDDNPVHPMTVSFSPGDEFILFTDGITEALGPSNELYGTDRLHKILKVNAGNAAERVKLMVADVDRFRQGHKPSDDQCILVMTRERSDAAWA